MEPAPLVGLSDETYELLDKLGEGGFGAVYLARKQPLRKLVALKVLDHRVSPEAERRLWDEALVLASLRHPGIVAAEDLVRFRGQLGLVTEYVEGEDLSACLADGLPASALVEAIGQVAWALHAAAQRGVVHRDVKPQNVRIGRHGNAKLLDFGIASAEGIDSDAAASLMGTPRVMAPERFGFQSGPPSDVFSLGCILWLGLTGSHFYGEARQFEEILPLTRSDAQWSDLVAAWPSTGLAELDQLALSMVSRRAEDRPTAAEVGRRCEALADQLPRRRGLSKWCRDRWPDGVEVPRRPLAERTASSLAPRGAAPPVDDPTEDTESVARPVVAAEPPPLPDDFEAAAPTDEVAREPVVVAEPLALPEPVLPRPLIAPVPADEAPPRAATTPWLAVGGVAAALIVLVLGGVGLAAWYATPEVAAVPTPSPLPPPVSAPLPDLPDRPERAPAPAATPEPAPKTARTPTPAAPPKPVAPKAGPKAAPAAGLADPTAVRTMISGRLQTLTPTVSSCGAATKGRWRLSFSVQPSGATSGIEVAGLDRDDAAVEACVAAKVTDWRFDPVAQAQPVSRTLRFP